MIERFHFGYISETAEGKNSNAWTPVFIATLFTIAKMWKHPQMSIHG